MGLLESLMNRDVSLWTTKEVRNFIASIESAVGKEIQIDIPLKHHFSWGVYAREVSLAAGSLVVGKIHKFTNLNVLTKGEVSILSIEGVVRIKAPATFVSSVGVKRVVYAHEDSSWMTIHGTHETNIDKIEEFFIAKSYDEVE